MHRYLRFAAFAALLTLPLAACDDDDDEDGNRFVATLAPTAGVTSNASGSATFRENNGVISFVVNGQNLNDITGAHIHTAPAPGGNGPVAVNLLDGPIIDPDNPFDVANGTVASGTFAATDVRDAAGVDFATLLQQMANGTAYVQIHTLANPGGEIRGGVFAR